MAYNILFIFQFWEHYKKSSIRKMLKLKPVLDTTQYDVKM